MYMKHWRFLYDIVTYCLVCFREAVICLRINKNYGFYLTKSSEDIIATWKSRKKATKQQTIAIIMFN